MSAPAAVEEAWSPEPELRVPAPRRLEPSPFPDLNTPNVQIYTVVGGIALALGLILIVLGFTGLGIVWAVLGLLLMVGGGVALYLPKQKAQQRRARSERLVRAGLPVMARIVTADNLTGNSAYARAVSYMVTMPGGDLVRRETNADDRALPKRIPGNVTALVDMETSDVELYCALPLRAALPAEMAAAAAQSRENQPDLPLGSAAAAPATAVPAGGPAGPAAPQPQTPPQEQQQKTSPGYQGLPWE
jgi:hypothetical protein